MRSSTSRACRSASGRGRQSFPVEVQEIEGVQDRVWRPEAGHGGVEGKEVAHPVLVHHDRLAVDHGRTRRQPGQVNHDPGQASRDVLPALREDADPPVEQVALRPVAVVLDLVLPEVAGRDVLGELRLGRRDERNLE